MKEPRMRTPFILSLIVLSALAAGSIAAMAGDAAVATPQDTFQDFTAFQQVRLGATALVNPDVAAQTRVLYAVDFAGAINGEQADELRTKIESGEVMVAKKTAEGSYTVLPPQQAFAFISQPDGSGKLLSAKELQPRSQKVIGWAK